MACRLVGMSVCLYVGIFIKKMRYNLSCSVFFFFWCPFANNFVVIVILHYGFISIFHKIWVDGRLPFVHQDCSPDDTSVSLGGHVPHMT